MECLVPEVAKVEFRLYICGPPKEPKRMAQYPKIETIGSIGSIGLAMLEVQVRLHVTASSGFAFITSMCERCEE